MLCVIKQILADIFIYKLQLDYWPCMHSEFQSEQIQIWQRSCLFRAFLSQSHGLKSPSSQFTHLSPSHMWVTCVGSAFCDCILDLVDWKLNTS